MTGERRSRRLFFALWPDDATRSSLAHATRKAVRGSGGRPIPLENLHTTVAFLGSIGEGRLAQLAGIAHDLGTGSFDVVLDQVEHWAKPMVLCATCTQSPRAAAALAEALRMRLSRAGFTPDLKPFRPHITLARKVVKPHALGPIHEVSWPVRELALVESETAPEGSRYTVLQSWAL